MKNLLEIAVFSSEAALLAAAAGADRLELCSGYAEGGLTPSAGTLQLVKENSTCPVFVMVRPRSGNFCYSTGEIEVMKRDVVLCKEMGADGIVLGILEQEHKVNRTALAELVRLAAPLPVTFHRAFDLCYEPLKEMEVLIDCGVKRILSSGQKSSAIEGIALLAELQEKASGRIHIMPGAGINPGNIVQIAKETGCQEFHASAKRMSTQADVFGFGEHILPHPEIIAELKKKLAL